MKRAITAILLAIMAIFITSCGGSGGSSGPTPPPLDPTQTNYILFATNMDALHRKMMTVSYLPLDSNYNGEPFQHIFGTVDYVGVDYGGNGGLSRYSIESVIDYYGEGKTELDFQIVFEFEDETEVGTTETFWIGMPYLSVTVDPSHVPAVYPTKLDQKGTD